MCVGRIVGPTTVDENTSVQYSVDVGEEPGLVLTWAIDPASAGKISNGHSRTATFKAARVTEDTPAQVNVIIQSECSDPVFKSLDILVLDIVPGGEHAPDAQAHAEGTIVTPTVPMQFFDDSTDPDGSEDIVQREWDFNFGADGFTVDSQDRNPVQAFAVEGTYLVQLRVTDSVGLSDTLDEPLTIIVMAGWFPPEARAVADAADVWESWKVQFQDVSFDPEGEQDIVKREWDFSFNDADGFIVESEEKDPEHEYTEAGTWLVQLRVTDSHGNEDMLDSPLEIRAHSGFLPVAAAHASQTDVTVGEIVLFFDDSTDVDSTIVKWEWDFSYDASEGFNEESQDQTPFRLFFNDGRYQVQLRVTDAKGASDMLDVPLAISVCDIRWGRNWVGEVSDIALDPEGNPLVCGWHKGATDFDGTDGTHIHEGPGCYLTKYAGNGDYLWAATWYAESCEDVEVDSSGCIYVQGHLRDAGYPGPGAPHQSSSGWYLTKLDENGAYQWHKFMATEVDVLYEATATTWYENSDMVLSGGRAFVLLDRHEHVQGLYGAYSDTDSYFIAAWNSYGTQVQSSGVAGGLYDIRTEEHNDLAMDEYGDFYYAGAVTLSKYDSGGMMLWEIPLSDHMGTRRIAIGNDSRIYVAMDFYGSFDADPGPGDFEVTSTGQYDIALICYSRFGDLVNAITIQSPSEDYLTGIDIGPSGNVYLTGSFQGGTDFDPGPGTWIPDGFDDVYLAVYDADLSFLWVQTWSADGELYSGDIATDSDDNSYLTGTFAGYSDFDPGPGTEIHVGGADPDNGWVDVYLNKLVELH